MNIDSVMIYAAHDVTASNSNGVLRSAYNFFRSIVKLTNPLLQDNRLPAVQLGESVQEYSNKYGMYINPADRTKYKHIEGKIIK